MAEGCTLSVEDTHELASSRICLFDEGDFHNGFNVDSLRRMMSSFLYRVKGLSFIVDKLAICSTNKIGFSNWEMTPTAWRGGMTCSTAGKASRDAVGFS